MRTDLLLERIKFTSPDSFHSFRPRLPSTLDECSPVLKVFLNKGTVGRDLHHSLAHFIHHIKHSTQSFLFPRPPLDHTASFCVGHY